MNIEKGNVTNMVEQWENEEGKRLKDGFEMGSIETEKKAQFCRDSYYELFKDDRESPLLLKYGK